ncbi:hypothetical protein B566_EDAN004391 [Ephemera danica]|nr:hypothetical protein B566_EDAN004391 [Ephemera danica]
MKRVAVIGAGAAGLAAARHLISRSQSFQFCVFEQSAQLGGTWVYTEKVGNDEFGLPIHSSMYKSLRTNLPKEVMGYPDFPIPEQPKSYLPAADILNFLDSYAVHFNIKKYIKFRHHVQSVRPIPGNMGWELKVQDLNSGVTSTSNVDAVMICNGHYNTPYIPQIPGADAFCGRVLHSHDYREPQAFSGQNVLVIGAGPSGMDLALEIASCAKQVILSHHNPEPIKTKFPSNVRMAPDVTNIMNDLVNFSDGSSAKIDTIFYCTGYRYNFPFLDAACGVRIIDNCVEPLYKHLIHIDHPSMCFIGLPFYVCAFSLFDLQSRFFLEVLDGTLELPSRELMAADTAREHTWRREQEIFR